MTPWVGQTSVSKTITCSRSDISAFVSLKTRLRVGWIKSLPTDNIQSVTPEVGSRGSILG